MRKNYNYTRRKLYLPEYGRHIHQMVDTLLTIEDRAERTRQAKAVIAVMGNINPMLRDTEEFKHKLWDHLFIMSDFQLDVDSPYMQPSRQDLAIRPEKLPYPQSRIIYKHYGKYTQKFVRHLVHDVTEGNIDKEMLNVARYMRNKSYEFNHEHPHNDSIMRDIRVMSGGEVDIDLSEIANMRSDYRQHQSTPRNVKGKKIQHAPARRVQKSAPKSAPRHAAHK